MRVLHVLDHSLPLHSGYAFRTAAILAEQRRLGWETVHVTGGKHTTDKACSEQVAGFEFHRTRPPRGLAASLPMLNQVAVVSGLASRLDDVIETQCPDLLHAHSPSLNGLAALRAAARHKLPVVYEVRAFWEDAAVDHGTHSQWGARYRLSRYLETRVLRAVDAVTCICEGLEKEIVARGVASDKVTVIPNAVELERFEPIAKTDEALKARLGLAGRRVMGFIGSFYGYEGLHLLIEAMPRVVEAVPDAAVLLVGGGPQEATLKEAVARSGLSDKVVFAGRVPHEEVRRFYSLIDVLVYPRLSMRLTETVTPLKPLEAMALERIFIASDVGGHRELVRDGETGLLFRAGDAQALASCAVKALTHAELWPALRKAGRAFVERERTWETSVARYREVYSRVIGKG